VGATHKLKPSPTRYLLPCIPLTQLRLSSEPLTPVSPPIRPVTIILTGDFAQLPPVSQHAFYSGGLGSTIHARTTPLQEATVGKSLWHLFTTVIILHQNMHQRSQSLQDSHLRTALENM